MLKSYSIIIVTATYLATSAPAFSHGGDDDDDDHALLQIQTPAETQAVTHEPDGLPMEIIPNWHPLFVHFTIALLLVSTLLFVVGKLAPATTSWRLTCLKVARWNLTLGAIITVGTIAAGWHAFNTVNHDNLSHLPMLSHRLWGLSTAGAFIILTLWSGSTRRKEPAPLFILCLLAASGSLAVTGYKGGELVYRHGLGVMSMPQMDGHMGHHDAGSPMTMPEMKTMPDMHKKENHEHHN